MRDVRLHPYYILFCVSQQARKMAPLILKPLPPNKKKGLLHPFPPLSVGEPPITDYQLDHPLSSGDSARETARAPFEICRQVNYITPMPVKDTEKTIIDKVSAGIRFFRVRYLTFAPLSMIPSRVATTRSLSVDAARIIPWDSTPFSLTGFRFATSITYFPASASGP